MLDTHLLSVDHVYLQPTYNKEHKGITQTTWQS